MVVLTESRENSVPLREVAVLVEDLLLVRYSVGAVIARDRMQLDSPAKLVEF
jgi:hypothetical protein